MGHQRANRLGNQCRRSGVEAVQHHEAAMRRRAEDDAGDAADLKAADLREDIDAVRRVGAVDFQSLPHDFNLYFQPFVGNVRASSGGLLRRKPADRCDDAGRRGRIGDAHFSGQETAAAVFHAFFHQFYARFEGANRFLAGHCRALRAVFRAESDFSLNQPRNPFGVRGDAEIGDQQLRAGKIGQRVCGGAARDEVIRGHLHRRRGRVGADVHFRHAVVAAADDGAFFRQVRVVVPRDGGVFFQELP